MTREEREQAIAYLETSFVAESNTDGGWSTYHNNVFRMAIKALEQDPLTDKEQRIFLAAMRREEKVCSYKDSLVSVCRSIKRKVKKALWE